MAKHIRIIMQLSGNGAFKICLSIAFIFYSITSIATNGTSTSLDFVSECYIYEGNIEKDINTIALSTEYEKLNVSIPNLGVSDNWHFLKVSVTNTDRSEDLFCFINNTSIDYIELYKIGNSLELLGSAGCAMPFQDRVSHITAFSFDLKLKPKESGWYLFKIKSGKQLIIPMQFGSENKIIELSGKNDGYMFLSFGIILVLLLYNLFLALSTKDKSYYYYTMYLASVGFVQLSLFGYGNKLIWPGSEWLSMHSVHLSGAFSGIATIIFAQDFIRSKTYAPVIHKILYGYIAIYSISIILTYFDYFVLAYNIINFCAASSLILLIAAIMAARKGLKSATYFVFAWTIFLVSVTVFAMKDFGVLPYNNFTIYALPFGSAAEGILISLALADKINQLKLEKEESDAMRIKTIESQNEVLEIKVHERTAELEDAKDHIQAQFDHLRITQKQLLESEKLAGLGQMTAGIAHELNNPINFVSSNVGPLHRDIEDVVNLLNEYHSLPENAAPEQIMELKEKYKKTDIDYVQKEIHQLLQGIEEGSRRTAEIVRGLRIFARADKDTLVTANVNECLQSTIVVMKSVTKGEVILTKEIDTAMPFIECFPGKLNQVIANLVSNAVYATKMAGRITSERKISVRSYHDDKYVHISVKDNGCGIAEVMKEQIFVPFFTTKNVGEGTGLGLSIALGIVEEHHGGIEVISVPGEGSEFIIHLPRVRKDLSLSAA